MKIYASRRNYNNLYDYIGTDLWVKVHESCMYHRDLYIQILSIQDESVREDNRVPGIHFNMVDAVFIDDPARRPFLHKEFLDSVFLDQFVPITNITILEPVEVLTQDEIVSRFQENFV